jgi:hypothetical protein
MAEISRVHIGVPDQGVLARILREGGAQLFPQWLSAETSAEPRLLWWGLRGAPAQLLDVPDDPALAGLFPRPIDDWSEAPRALVLAAIDAERAAASLAPALPGRWHDAGLDEQLGARVWRLAVGRSALLLAEPSTEGYTAACLARFGEGPIAVALDGTTAAGRSVARSPVSDGPATYVRIDRGTAPTLIFLPARG